MSVGSEGRGRKGCVWGVRVGPSVFSVGVASSFDVGPGEGSGSGTVLRDDFFLPGPRSLRPGSVGWEVERNKVGSCRNFPLPSSQGSKGSE